MKVCARVEPGVTPDEACKGFEQMCGPDYYCHLCNTDKCNINEPLANAVKANAIGMDASLKTSYFLLSIFFYLLLNIFLHARGCGEKYDHFCTFVSCLFRI
jgi:hypothetical protein